ncbi:MAG: hypothetical protein JSU81_05390 [Candidatus Coatesbacteria bacterium]|nr:MAG: hypothetical protein JSU81_05390 [Candidatus Coatesbacteria bacterium]
MKGKSVIAVKSVGAAVAALTLACAPVTLAPETDDPGTTWVADVGSSRVIKINKACSAFVASSPDLGRPVAVLFDSYNGYCWAADAEGGRIIRLTSRAVVEKTLYGFGEPVALAYCPKENAVWVADRGQGRIVKLTERGTVRAELGGLNEPAAIAVNPLNGEVFVACAAVVVRTDRWGQPLGRYYGFDRPAALAFDAGYGYLWVADTGNGRVVRLKPSGEVVAVSNALAAPTAVAVNPRTGFAFAADAAAGKVVSVRGDGSLRWANTEYERPTALAVNPTDMSLWVADSYSFSVYKLKGNTGAASDYESVAGLADPVALFTDPGIR